MLSTPVYSESGNKLYSKPLLTGNVVNSYIKFNAALPLWSAKSMFDNEYLQVEILADREVPLEKSTDDILNMNSYTCHICDTEVPKSYTAEHNNGNKHKTCMKIADLVLERTRKHMKLNNKERLSIQVRETYFCDPCTTVIQKADKIDHESSVSHLKSLRHDELLNDFLMIYENKESIVLVTEKRDIIDLKVSENIEAISCNSDDAHEQIEEPKESLKETEIQKQTELDSEPLSSPKSTKTHNINEEENMSDVSRRMVKQLSDNISKYFPEKYSNSTKAEKKGNSQKASNELINYIKSITEKCKTDPIHTIEVLTDKLILITAINGDQIKIPVVNFHSIHKQKEKSYCKICEDPNVGVFHEMSEEHMDKIMVPIEDKNGIRKIDDIWSNCILCNDLTKNINFHLQSILHRNKLKHCLIDTGIDINENVLPKPSQKDTSQLIQEHNLYVSHNNSEITCNICDITLLNKPISIEEHIKTFDHVTKYNTKIEDNRLSEIDDLQYYCMPCDMCVIKSYALGHCNGRKHNKHLNDLISKEIISNDEECTQIILPSISQQIKRSNHKNNLRQNNTDLICFVCNVVLYSVHKHMNSLDHKRNYLSYLEANKLNEIEEDTFYCIPCNTVILLDYLMSHCTSKKHKTHLKNRTSNDQEINNQSSGQLITENTHISRSIKQSIKNQALIPKTLVMSQNGIFDTAIPLKHLYQFREMSNSRNLLCTICDEEVPYRKFEVQSHVNLIDHVVAFNLVMLWNKIKRLNDKYYCNVCKVDVTYFNELSHVTSAEHVSMMSDLPKGTFYEYDRTLLTLEYAMSHKVGDRVTPSSIISVAKSNE